MYSTRRKALQECVKLWTWLAENPLAAKDEYFKLFRLSTPYNYCPACEYAHQRDPAWLCHKCPVDAWRKQAKECGYFPCCADTSPYANWRDTRSPTHRHEYALEVRALAQASLDKLPKLKKES